MGPGALSLRRPRMAYSWVPSWGVHMDMHMHTCLSRAALCERRWWTEGGAAGQADGHDNPNDLITQSLFPDLGVPDQCHLDYYHKVRGANLDHGSRSDPLNPSH